VVAAGLGLSVAALLALMTGLVAGNQQQPNRGITTAAGLLVFSAAAGPTGLVLGVAALVRRGWPPPWGSMWATVLNAAVCALWALLWLSAQAFCC
jgi:hypothetical protein